MTPAIDVPPKDLKTLNALLKEHLPGIAVWAYGSRVKWTSRPDSDLDMVAFALPERLASVAALRTACEESNLPFRVDLFVWDEVPEKFRKTIEAEHAVLQDDERARCATSVAGVWTTSPLDQLSISFDWKRMPVKESDRRPGPYPYYGASGVVDHVDNYLFDGEYLLVAEDGENLRTRQTPIAFLARGKFWVNNHAHIITANEKADTRFLMYALRHVGIDAYLTGAVMPKLTQGNLNRIEILHPSLSEQRAIAGVLGALDDKIEQNRRTGRALETLARAIFRAWFVDFEPVKAKAAGANSFPGMPRDVFDALPAEFAGSNIGPIPKGWEVKAIGDVVTTKGGGTPSTKNPVFWDGGVHCWATPKDMSRLSHPVLLDTERRITDAGVDSINSGILPVGTVLMSSLAPVGYLAIADVPTAINQGFIAMVCDGPLPPVYVLNWAFTSMDTIKAHASGTTFPEISKKNFRPLPVVQPTGDVIAAYQQAADPLFEMLIACVRENEKLSVMRDYLLPKLLSGSVRVEIANG